MPWPTPKAKEIIGRGSAAEALVCSLWSMEKEAAKRLAIVNDFAAQSEKRLAVMTTESEKRLALINYLTAESEKRLALINDLTAECRSRDQTIAELRRVGGN